ncbi:CBN-GST-36 protein [Aphelenchoides avenae]|nr:CBN-GST-36 protein [Aphelenchus avenae]
MSNHYKLYYFNLRARAEPIRILLHHALQQYEAVDFAFEEWDSSYKSNLEANSVEEQAICDMFGEQIQDYIAKARDWSWTFFGFQPAEKRDEFFEKDIQPIVDEIGQIFGEQLKKNGNGYFVGSKITWFDIFLAEFIDKIIGHAKPGVFSKYPIIEQHHKKIFSLPSIAKYVKERPPRPY